MSDIITNIDQFEKIDLNVPETKAKEVTDIVAIDDIPSLDNLNLDDIEKQQPTATLPPVEDVHTELKNAISTKLEDLDLSLDGLDIPAVEIKTIPVAAPVIEPIPEKLEPVVTTPVVTTPIVTTGTTVPETQEVQRIKRGRKPKEQTPEKPEKALNGRWFPEFDISLVKMTKYQTRHVNRTKEELDELAALIASQGQIEPVHIHLENNIYELIAGFGRTQALLSLNAKTIKAIIYENLDQSDLTMISAGTNTGRVQLSDWDKIASLGTFAAANPNIPTTSANLNEKTLLKIFGLSQSTIYNYVRYFEYFSKKPAFIDVLKTIRIPMYVISGIFDNRDEFKNEDIFVGLMKNSYALNKKTFDAMLDQLVSEERTKLQIQKDEIALRGLDAKPSVPDELPDLDLGTSTGITTEGKDENQHHVDENLNKITKNIDEINRLMTELLVMENRHLYIKQDKMTVIQKRLNIIAKVQLQLLG